MGNYYRLLANFKAILISGEKYVTMSIIVPLIRGLQFSLRNVFPTTPIGTSLQMLLIDMVARRLGNLETNKIVAKATFLDPRFKKAGFGHEDNAKNAQQWVTDELSQLINQNQAQRVVTNYPAPVTNQLTGPTLWAHFDEKVAQNYENPSTTTSAIIMVKQYLESRLVNRNENPLNYWREHSKVFPAHGVYSRKEIFGHPSNIRSIGKTFQKRVTY